MKKTTAFLLLHLLYAAAFSQSLWQNPITGPDPGNENPFTSGDVVAAGITVSGIGRSAEVSGDNGDDRYTTDGWANVTSFNAEEYLTFTITPVSGKRVSFDSFEFNFRRTATGPYAYELRSSVDGFAAAIGANSVLPANTSASSENFDLSGAAFQNLATPVEFRLYAWGATNGNGNFSVNDFQFNGFVANTLAVSFGPVAAIRKGDQLTVNWSTHQEKHNSHFEIQASVDGSAFQTIKTVIRANGEADFVQYYEAQINLRDAQPLFAMSLLIMLLGWSMTRKVRSKWVVLLLILMGFGWLSCQTEAPGLASPDDRPIFVRIKQVDINKSASYSPVVRVISE
ncbi:hypothetical protein ABDK00_002880 [Niabella insulamsoli]|uniref:hypothetical protein n=1 Tax=Niabella insulamsoli TaxID=3144874 RepID=UPI0031FD15A3